MAEQARTTSLAALGLTAQTGADAQITGLAVDSRAVRPGNLFAALPGTRVHGGEFIKYALRMGAGAILTDREGARIARAELAASGVPLVLAEDAHQALAFTAALWFGRQPSQIVAVTGTNGKTSVATFLRQIWTSLDVRAVNLGTTGVEGDLERPLAHTTPDPITLHGVLAQIAAEGIEHVAMEASSHGLAQRRLDGVQLAAAGFTNFSQDHLDYHADLDDYYRAKEGLFSRILAQDAPVVANIDDKRGRRIASEASLRGQDVVSVGRDARADLRILGQRFDATGQDVRFDWHGAVHMVRLPMIGGFQADNVMLAAALAIVTGSEAAAVFDSLSHLKTVRGRMQLVAKRNNGASVFVDFAHTPDAIATALQALRPHVIGRLVAVIGAGGDRDPSKRILMGQAAADHADVVFVTDDNPRSEDPATIRAMIMQGCPQATEIGDRAEAILRAVDALQPGDGLLIAGKGHESGQIIGDDVFPFDDAEQASVAVAALDGHGL